MPPNCLPPEQGVSHKLLFGLYQLFKKFFPIQTKRICKTCGCGITCVRAEERVNDIDTRHLQRNSELTAQL